MNNINVRGNYNLTIHTCCCCWCCSCINSSESEYSRMFCLVPDEFCGCTSTLLYTYWLNTCLVWFGLLRSTLAAPLTACHNAIFMNSTQIVCHISQTNLHKLLSVLPTRFIVIIVNIRRTYNNWTVYRYKKYG